MLLNHITNLEHQLKVWVFRRDGKDVGLEAVLFPKTLLKVFQLWKNEEVIDLPEEEEGLDLGVSLRRPAPVWEGPSG